MDTCYASCLISQLSNAWSSIQQRLVERGLKASWDATSKACSTKTLQEEDDPEGAALALDRKRWKCIISVNFMPIAWDMTYLGMRHDWLSTDSIGWNSTNLQDRHSSTAMHYTKTAYLHTASTTVLNRRTGKYRTIHYGNQHHSHFDFHQFRHLILSGKKCRYNSSLMTVFPIVFNFKMNRHLH